MLLALRDVKKSYSTEEGPVDVLKGVSLELDAGQHLALTGNRDPARARCCTLSPGWMLRTAAK